MLWLGLFGISIIIATMQSLLTKKQLFYQEAV
jgi:hypothetical protein